MWAPGEGARPCCPQCGTPRGAPSLFPPQLLPDTAVLSSAEPVTVGGWQHQLMFGCGCEAQLPCSQGVWHWAQLTRPTQLALLGGAGTHSCLARDSHRVAVQNKGAAWTWGPSSPLALERKTKAQSRH